MAYLEPKTSEYLTGHMKEEMIQPMYEKHDYRDITIGENTKITIDVEDVNRKMKKEFYRNIGIGFHIGGLT